MITPMIALLEAQAVPPPIIVSDYAPGPWRVLFDRTTGRLADESVIVERVREAQTVLPQLRFELCWQGGLPIRANVVRSLAARFRRAGLQRLRVTKGTACADDATVRDQPGVLIQLSE